jgi:type IV pilus assembly protein PilV
MGTSPKLIHQKGLSLIEVLVALIIFAFGMLGVAGLQVATLKSNKFAASSATAISLAREYGELMQSFPSVNISTSTGASPFFIDTSTFLTPNPSLCTGSSAACTSAQLAQAAMQDWSLRVKEALPGGGRAEICRTSEPRNADGDLQWAHCDGIGDLVVVKIGWAARSDKGENLFDSDRPKILLPLLGNLRDFAAP